MEGVRICTSGGASSRCPGLATAIANAYRAMQAAERGEQSPAPPSLMDLEAEVAAWRERFSEYAYRPKDDCVVLQNE